GSRGLQLFLMLTTLFNVAASGQTFESTPTDGAPTMDVFKSGTEGYHTFRIPVMLMSKKGTLLAFCEGRRDSIRDHGTIFLLLKRSFDQGRTWQPLQVIWSEEGHTSGNPTPVVDDNTGRVLL